MFALLALVAFIVGLVKVDSFDIWPAWLLLGLALLAADAVFTGFGLSYPRITLRRET